MAASLMSAVSVQAINYTWDGEGALTNAAWTNAANWSPDGVPPNPFPFAVNANDGTALFTNAPADLNSVVPLPWAIGRLSFATTAGDMVLSGADITLGTGQNAASATTPNIQFNATGRTITISNNLIFVPTPGTGFPRRQMYMVNAGTLNVYGNLIKSNDNVSSFTIRGGNASGIFNVYGAITHTDLNVGKTDNSVVVFHNPNNQFPGVDVAVGTVRIGADNALPTTAYADFVQNANATLDLNDFNQTLSGISNSVANAGANNQRILLGAAAGSTLTLNDNGRSVTFNGTISGTGRLRKMGNGSLTFATKNQTYTGGTLINGGTLRLGNGGAAGLLDGTGNITNNATLIINSTDPLTLNGNLSGTGSLQKLLTTPLALHGINSYSGATTIADGPVTLGANGGLSNSVSISLGNTATLDASAAAGGVRRGAGQSLNGGGTVIGDLTAGPGSTITVGSSPGKLILNNNATFDASTINMELGVDAASVDGTVNDIISVAGALTLNGVTTINITPLAALSTTTPYSIMQFGSVAGFASNLNVALPAPGRYTFTVQDPATTAPFIKVAVSASLNGNLLWRGGNPANPTLWDVSTTTNWLNGGVPDRFLSGDPVAFDDTALTNRATLGGPIVATSIVASNATLNYTVAGGGPLAVNSISKHAAGSLTIGNSTGNALGAVTVNNGTLVVANSGSNSFAGIAVNGGTLSFDQPINVTVAAGINGTGALAKNGTNTLTLSANNSAYAGNVQINNGVLKVSANHALGDGTATIASGATLELSSTAANGLSVGLADVTVQGPGFGGLGAIRSTSAYQAFALTNITLAGDTTLGGGWETVGGTFTGAGFKVTKVGTNDFYIGSFTDTDIGDMDIQQGLFGFEFLGTTLGRPGNTITVRSNASLGFWANVGTGNKQVVMEDGAKLFAGGGANGPSLFGGTMSLAGNAHANINAATILTYSGNIFGTGKLMRDGAAFTGMLELAAANTHTGGTEVFSGQLRLGHDLALSNNQAVAVFPSGTGGFVAAGTTRLELSAGRIIPPGVTANFYSWTNTGDYRTTFYAASGANEWHGPINVRSNGVVNFGMAAGTTLLISGPVGDTNFTGTLAVRGTGGGSGTQAGRVTLNGTFATFAKTDAASWTISSASNLWAFTTIAVGNLILGTNDALCPTAPITMGQGDANTTTLDLYGFNQRITSLASTGGTGGRRIANDSTTSDSILTYDGGTNVSTYSGILMDSYSLGTMKLGLTVVSGTLFLNGDNTNTGPTLVKSGATLGGTGTIRSPVTVEGGGIFAPGASIGTLTLINSLTLNSGSISVFEVSHNPLASDKVTALTSVVYAGTLVITNVGAEPLATGDVFTLFESASYSGSFSSIQPATPGNGLTWDTSTLNTDGKLRVSGHPLPHFDLVSKLGDGNFRFTISGALGDNYSVRASTNVTLPVSNWTILKSATITASPFTYDDLTATNFARRFYLISIP